MPDILASALSAPGVGWLGLTIAVAGIVRGFSGFGTALIFVPVAGIFLEPEITIALITLTGVASSGALVPRAWGQADRGEVALLGLAAMATVPLGLWLLAQLDRETVRWIVTGVAATTLGALIVGWRFHGRLRRSGLAGIGALAGLIGGLTGLTGPAVILFYLAGQGAARAVRANTILFLAMLDVAVIGNLLLRGSVGFETVILAMLLSAPHFVTTLVGQALFDPRHERLYRAVAYGVIGLALVTGLPIWD